MAITIISLFFAAIDVYKILQSIRIVTRFVYQTIHCIFRISRAAAGADVEIAFGFFILPPGAIHILHLASSLLWNAGFELLRSLAYQLLEPLVFSIHTLQKIYRTRSVFHTYIVLLAGLCKERRSYKC